MPAHPTRRLACVDCGGWFRAKWAKYCPDCRWRRRGRPTRHVWTEARDALLRERYDSHVRGRVGELAKTLGFPRWVVSRRASFLGIARMVTESRRVWTRAEEQFLRRHIGKRTPHWIAGQLKRSETSIVVKTKRMALSRRFTEGYTMRHLCDAFGVDHHGARRWEREGKLRVKRRGYRGHRNPWCVSEAEVLRFIKNHPTEFNLRSVNQEWFMGLLLRRGVVDRAIAGAELEEELREKAA